jgi:hypothetical protein
MKKVHERRRIRVLKVVFSMVLQFLAVGVCFGFLADTDSHPPPSSGTYIYSPPGAFCPNVSPFSAVGKTYVDPVFGETVKRITDVYGSSWRAADYSAHLNINANNTMCFIEGSGGGWYIHSLANGSLLKSSGFQSPYVNNFQWHPTDSDKLLTMTSSALYEYSYSANSSTLIATFGSGLNNGGTADFTNATGRYYVGNVGGTLRFYDRTTSTFYGNQPSVGSLDYIAMAPDGSGVIVAGGTDGVTWWTVNHATRSWNSGYGRICNGSPHGDIMMDTDGVVWFIADGHITTRIGSSSVSSKPGTYMIPVKNAAGYKYSSYGTWTNAKHYSGNILGANSDWFLVNQYLAPGGENINDSAPWNSWYAYRQEIGLVNVKTLDVRRLVHHRSRQSQNGDPFYYSTPRGSLSADGSLVIFNSNMGRASVSTIYADVYTVTTGLTAGSNTQPPPITPPEAPSGLRIQQP